MGFWDNIGIAIEDDSNDKVDHNIEKSNDAIINAEFEASVRNLPKGEVYDSNGLCATCGTYAEGLGNELCATCWDYVVDYSSPNSKFWPDVRQYNEIYKTRLTLS